MCSPVLPLVLTKSCSPNPSSNFRSSNAAPAAAASKPTRVYSGSLSPGPSRGFSPFGKMYGSMSKTSWSGKLSTLPRSASSDEAKSVCGRGAGPPPPPAGRRQREQRGQAVADRGSVGGLVRLRPDARDRHVGRRVGIVLLVEILAVNAVGKPAQCEWAVVQVREGRLVGGGGGRRGD